MDNKTLWISPDALGHNLAEIRKALRPGTRLWLNLKANAYGHDATLVASIVGNDARYLAVAQASEGLRLKASNDRLPVVVYNPPVEPEPEFFAARLQPVIYDMGQARHYHDFLKSKGLERYPVHIQLDTGMHRSGLLTGQNSDLLDFFRGQSILEPRSIFSHLAAADDPGEDDFTRAQIRLFDELSRPWKVVYPGLLRHLANTAGIFRFPESHFDMVRPGISLYGYHTLPADAAPGLRPVASLRARITQVREIDAGESVGYNRTYRAPSPRRIALVPAGYADGIRRLASERGLYVRCGAYRCPIVGRVSMDLITVDATGTDVRPGDWVEIFGRDPRVEVWAGALQTIPYEILTDVHPRVPRILRHWD